MDMPKYEIPLIGCYRKYEVVEVWRTDGTLSDFQCPNPEIQAYGRKIYDLPESRGPGKLWAK